MTITNDALEITIHRLKPPPLAPALPFNVKWSPIVGKQLVGILLECFLVYNLQLDRIK